MFALRGSLSSKQTVFRDDVYFVADPALGPSVAIGYPESRLGITYTYPQAVEESYSDYLARIFSEVISVNETTGSAVFPTGRRIYFRFPVRLNAFPERWGETTVGFGTSYDDYGFTEVDAGFQAFRGSKTEAYYALRVLANYPEDPRSGPPLFRPARRPLDGYLQYRLDAYGETPIMTNAVLSGQSFPLFASNLPPAGTQPTVISWPHRDRAGSQTWADVFPGIVFTVPNKQGTYYAGDRSFIEAALLENNDSDPLPVLVEGEKEIYLYRNTPNDPLLARVVLVTEVRYTIDVSSCGLKELSLVNCPILELNASSNQLTNVSVQECGDLLTFNVESNRLTDSGLVYEGAGVNLGEILARRGLDAVNFYNQYPSVVPGFVYLQSVNVGFNLLQTAPFISNGAGVGNDYLAANNRIESISFLRGVPQYRLDLQNQFPESATEGLVSFVRAPLDPVFSNWSEETNLRNNLLTALNLSGDLGTVRELDVADNQLGPTFTLPEFDTTYGEGYKLVRLDLSSNNLQSIDVSQGEPLLELDVSDNPLTALSLPGNGQKTYYDNRSPYWEDYNYLGGGDVITGDWSQYGVSGGSQSQTASQLFRHLTGVQRLFARNTLLTGLPAQGRRSIQVLDLRDNPLLQTIGSSTAPAPLTNGTLGPWVPIVKDSIGFRINSGHQNIQTFADNVNQNTIVVFRNLVFSNSPVSSTRYPRSGHAYMIHRAPYITTQPSSRNFTVIDTINDNRKREPNGDGDGQLVFYGSNQFSGLQSGEAAFYNSVEWPHLHEAKLDNCPALTAVNFTGAPLLNSLTIDGSPNLNGTLFDARVIEATTPSWRGGTGNINNLVLKNVGGVNFWIRPRFKWHPIFRAEFLNLTIDGATSINAGESSAFFSEIFPAPVVCRNGVQVRAVGAVTTTVLALHVLRALGQWSFSSALPTDSNVVDFSGTVATGATSTARSTYNDQKAAAISRGWQVIDPTFV
jgi:hypothetical protein